MVIAPPPMEISADIPKQKGETIGFLDAQKIIDAQKMARKNILKVFEKVKDKGKNKEDPEVIKKELAKKNLEGLPKKIIKEYNELLDSIASAKEGELVIDKKNPGIGFIRMNTYNKAGAIVGYKVYYNTAPKKDNVRGEVTDIQNAYCRITTGAFIRLPKEKKDKAYQMYKGVIYFVYDGKRYDNKTLREVPEEIEKTENNEEAKDTKKQ